MRQVIVVTVVLDNTETILLAEFEGVSVCIGIPMQIIEQHEFSALCRGRGGERVVETLLIGEQPPGTWVLTYLGSAREVLSPEEAHRISAALDLVDAMLNGDEALDLDAPFADLMDPARPPGGFQPDRSDG